MAGSIVAEHCGAILPSTVAPQPCDGTMEPAIIKYFKKDDSGLIPKSSFIPPEVGFYFVSTKRGTDQKTGFFILYNPRYI